MPDAEQTDGPEALAWFQQMPAPLGLDLHKELRPVEDALRYVRGLYALGACRVSIPAWAIARKEPLPWRPGGLWARALEVTLPPGGPEREALIWFCATELSPTYLFPDQAASTLHELVNSQTALLCWP